MTRAKRQPTKPQAARPAVGDCVLLGAPGITQPADWFIAEVLWVGASDLLVHQAGFAGMRPHRAVHEHSRVRAIGSYAALRQYRDQCCREVKPLCRAVDVAEEALARARKAMFDQLDVIAAASPVALSSDGEAP